MKPPLYVRRRICTAIECGAVFYSREVYEGYLLEARLGDESRDILRGDFERLASAVRWIAYVRSVGVEAERSDIRRIERWRREDLWRVPKPAHRGSWEKEIAVVDAELRGMTPQSTLRGA